MRSGDARSWILTGKVTLLCRCVSGDSRAEHASGSAQRVQICGPEAPNWTEGRATDKTYLSPTNSRRGVQGVAESVSFVARCNHLLATSKSEAGVVLF